MSETPHDLQNLAPLKEMYCLLFNLMLDQTLKKIKIEQGGINVGGKINVLAFADDIAIIAENKRVRR